MKLNKFAYLYSKPLGNHTLKIMKNNTWKFTLKNLENHGNIMEFCQSEKVGTLILNIGKYIFCIFQHNRN